MDWRGDGLGFACAAFEVVVTRSITITNSPTSFSITMTLVRIGVGPSSIHGLGCIARERIEKGEIVWRFDERFDKVIRKEVVDGLPAAARENLLNYAFVSRATGDYILCSDDSRFTNHSPDPNIVCVVPEGTTDNDLVCYAKRTILPGEEMTNDYREFDEESGEDLTFS